MEGEIDHDGIVETTSERGEVEEGVEPASTEEDWENIGRSHHRSSSRSRYSRTGRSDHSVHRLRCWERRNCYHHSRAVSNPYDDKEEDADRIDPWLRPR